MESKFKYKIILFTVFFPFGVFANECMDTRAAIEIGSVTTKVKIGKVNICTKKLETILFEDIFKFSLEDELTKEKRKILTEQILEFKNKAQEFSPSIIKGVTSSFFFNTSNGISFLKEIEEATSVYFTLLDFEKHTKLAFLSVLQDTDELPQNLVIWDIGGFQMRMISKDEKGDYLTYMGENASIQFKNQIISEIKKQDPKKIKTPNPIDQKTFKKSLQLSETWAKSVGEDIRKKISSPNIKIIGIGGVHYFSVRPQIDAFSKRYSQIQLESVIKKNLNTIDEKLSGDFRETQVSNLILVLGFMKELKIESIETFKVNLTDGILIDPNLSF